MQLSDQVKLPVFRALLAFHDDNAHMYLADAFQGGVRPHLSVGHPSLGGCLFLNLSGTGRQIRSRLDQPRQVKDWLMRLSGTVKFFNTAKGFGFIAPDGGAKDVFVHASALEAAGLQSLNEGDKVSFSLEDDKKGRGQKAVDLQKS
jgi:CspA family cold shock protein